MHNDSDMSPDAWRDWLRSFRERFIAEKGWSEKEAKLRTRDKWVCVRDDQVHFLANEAERPADAVPVFEIRTLGGWMLPIEIKDRLTGLIGRAIASERSPRDIVLVLLNQLERGDPGESAEIQQQRSIATSWSHLLLDACEDETLPGVLDSDVFWQALLYAFQVGRRYEILDLHRNPQALADLLKAQAFQSGRAPDELTRRLEEKFRELRDKRGRNPKPREVVEAAGGVWSEIDDCWQFDDIAGLPSVPSGALYDRLDKIRQKLS
jgi:hypothetical protein